MEKSPGAILELAAKLARASWDEGKSPFPLAGLSPELEKLGIDYREVIPGQKLKDFIHSAPNIVKVISHPKQKAKIGLIPADMSFEYPDQPQVTLEVKSLPPAPEFRNAGKSKRYLIVSSFLGLVSELDEADAAQVQIPTHILAKLMRDK